MSITSRMDLPRPAGRQGPPTLAEPRRTGRGRFLPGAPRSRVPQPGRAVAGRAQPAPVPPADGGVAGLIRDRGLRASIRPIRSCPMSSNPRVVVPGKPLFFATAVPLNGLGDRRAGREPHRPAHQDRGQPRHPASLGGDRCVHPGGHPVALRPRPLPGRDQPGTRQHLGTIPEPGSWRSASRPAGLAGEASAS